MDDFLSLRRSAQTAHLLLMIKDRAGIKNCNYCRHTLIPQCILTESKVKVEKFEKSISTLKLFKLIQQSARQIDSSFLLLIALIAFT